MVRRAILATAVALVVLAGCGSPSTATKHLPRSVDGLDGGTVALVTPDAVTVVAFIASWCTPCRRELPKLEERHRAAGSGVRYVAVAVEEEPPATRKLVADTGITFPVGVDPDGVALADYGFVGLPGILVLNGTGKVEHRYQGSIDFDDLDRRLAELGT